MNSILTAFAIWVLVRNVSKLLIEMTDKKNKKKPAEKQPPPAD